MVLQHHRERESMRYRIAGIAEGSVEDEAATLWMDWRPCCGEAAGRGGLARL